MRDSTKVVIGLGSIWGLYAFAATFFSAFTLGSNDTAPEIFALLLYGLTILPSCILAIWHARLAGFWLLSLTPITAFGAIYQIATHWSGNDQGWSIGKIAWLLFVVALPGLIGLSLLRTVRRR